MAIVVEATFENGVFKPVLPMALGERTRVRLTISPLAERSEDLERVEKATG